MTYNWYRGTPQKCHYSVIKPDRSYDKSAQSWLKKAHYKGLFARCGRLRYAKPKSRSVNFTTFIALHKDPVSARNGIFFGATSKRICVHNNHIKILDKICGKTVPVARSVDAAKSMGFPRRNLHIDIN